MATSTEIVTRALRKLAILQPGATASAAMLTHGIDELNDMMDGFAAKGVNISPTTPLPAQHRPALIAMLAMRLSPSYGEAAIVPPALAAEAQDGWFSLQAAYIFAPNAQFDIAVSRVPSQRYASYTDYDITGGDLPSSSPSVSGFCVLSAGSPTTTVTDANCTTSSSVTLTPYSETAQAEWNAVRPEVEAGDGTFTITHLNNQILDRVFEYLIVI